MHGQQNKKIVDTASGTRIIQARFDMQCQDHPTSCKKKALSIAN